MNLVGLAGVLILGAALIVNLYVREELSAAVLAFTMGFYAILALVALLSALACTNRSSRRLTRIALWANWAMIVLWCCSIVSALVFGRLTGLTIMSALAFVIPQAINIKALRGILRGQWLELEPFEGRA